MACSPFIDSPTSIRVEFGEKMQVAKTWCPTGLFLYGLGTGPIQIERFRRSTGRTGGPFAIFATDPRRRRRHGWSTGRRAVNWSKNIRFARSTGLHPVNWSRNVRSTGQKTYVPVNWSKNVRSTGRETYVHHPSPLLYSSNIFLPM